MVSLLLVLVVVVVLLAGLWAYGTAHRLDRLHVRLDSAWLALDAALSRRALVARTLALGGPATLSGSTTLSGLATLASAAERTDPPNRESVENALSTALAEVALDTLAPQLAAELADAQTRVLLARRFHNDAVRDTLALRRRRSVRWLRLGGTAPLPHYFEIVESTPTDSARPPRRPAARVVLLDNHDRVLLLRAASSEVEDSFYWLTTGGGVEPGETVAEAAVREVAEETGLHVEVDALRGPLWWRRAIVHFDWRTFEAEETYFVASVASFDPRHDGFTELEKRTIVESRWCSPADVMELERVGERVYPPGLAELLPEALGVAHAAERPAASLPRKIP